MKRYMIIVITMVINVLLISFWTLICKVRKRKNKSSWFFGLILLMITMFVMILIFVGYTDFDKNGYVRFNDDNVWKYGAYFSEDNNEYYIEILETDEDTGYPIDGNVININNNGDIHSLKETFITSEGYLVFDKNLMNNEVEEGVYIDNSNRRLYSIVRCEYDVFGNLKLFEPKGFYIGDHLIKPVMFDGNLSFKECNVKQIICNLIEVFESVVIYVSLGLF